MELYHITKEKYLTSILTVGFFSTNFKYKTNKNESRN